MLLTVTWFRRFPHRVIGAAAGDGARRPPGRQGFAVNLWAFEREVVEQINTHSGKPPVPARHSSWRPPQRLERHRRAVAGKDMVVVWCLRT